MFEEIKTIAKHSSVYSAAVFLKKGIGFIMIPIYTRFLTSADYGVLELLSLVLEIIATIVGFRLIGGMTRYYHHYDNPRDKEEVLTTTFIFTAIVSLAFLVVLQLLSKPISAIVSGSTQYVTCFQIVFICLAVQNVYLISENYLLIKKRSFLYSTLSIVTLVVGLSFNILFLVFLKMGVIGILYSMLIAKLLNLIIVVPISLRNIRMRFSWEKLFEMIRFSLPLIPASVSILIVHFSDRIFVQKYCTLDELGLYSLGYKFGMIVSIMISAPIFQIWNTYRFEIAKRSDAKQVMSRVFTYYSTVLIFISLALSVYIREIIAIMASSAFQGSASVVPLIILSYVFHGISTFFSIGIAITYKTKYAAYIQALVAVINILLNLFLIPNFGIMGAAISTILTFLCFFGLSFIISQKLYPLPLEYQRLFLLCGISLAIFFISSFVNTSLIISIGIKAILIVAFPICLFVCGFFYSDEVTKGLQLLRDMRSKFAVNHRLK